MVRHTSLFRIIFKRILTRKFMGWCLYIFIKIESPSYENDSDTKSGKDKQQTEVDNLPDIAVNWIRKVKKVRNF